MAVTYPKITLTVKDGQVLHFSKDEIVSASLIEELNPVSTILPIGTLSFRLFSSSEAFSFFSTSEYFQLFSERQPIILYENINSTDHEIGRYFLDTWNCENEQIFKFEAYDTMGILEATDYDGGLWSSATAIEDILSTLLDDQDVDYEVDDRLTAIELRGWIPPGNYRDALQQVCFAAGAMITGVRSGTLNFEPSKIPYCDDFREKDIQSSVKLKEQKVDLQPLVTDIEIISHNYSQGDDLETYFDEVLDAGFYKIVFDKPLYDVTITGAGYIPYVLATEDDEVIVTEDDEYIVIRDDEYIFGPNCVYLYVYPPGGTVTIEGYLWVDSQQAFDFEESGVERYDNRNVKRIERATMVCKARAQSILNGLRDYFRGRYKQAVTLFVQRGTKYGGAKYNEVDYGWCSENVHLGDIVNMTSFYDAIIRAVIEKIEIDLTGGFLVKATAVGVESE